MFGRSFVPAGCHYGSEADEISRHQLDPHMAENEHVRRLVEEALFHADHVVQDFPDHGEHAPAKAARRTRS